MTGQLTSGSFCLPSKDNTALTLSNDCWSPNKLTQRVTNYSLGLGPEDSQTFTDAGGEELANMTEAWKGNYQGKTPTARPEGGSISERFNDPAKQTTKMFQLLRKKSFAKFKGSITDNKVRQEVDETPHDKYKAMAEKLESGPAFFNPALGVINTESDFMTRWDGYMIFLLIYTGIVTPYEVAFMETDINVNFFINRIMDVSFCIDIIFNFFLPYHTRIGMLVTDRKQIFWYYMSFWFWIDFISVIPYELIIYMRRGSTSEELKVLRNIRCLRIAKLARVLRSSTMFKRWESRLEINYSQLNLAGLLVSLLTLSHWMACCWAILLRIEGDSHITDFCNGEEGYCTYPMSEESEDEMNERVRGYWVENPLKIYIMLLSWTFGMIVGVGYQIMLRTDVQRSFCFVYMLLAGISNALIIGNVVNLLDQMQDRTRELHASMDNLNFFLRMKGMTKDDPDRKFLLNGEYISGPTLCARLREYYLFTHNYSKHHQSFARVTEKVCPSLNAAIMTTVYTDSIKKVKFFQASTDALITLIANEIQTNIYCIHDIVFSALEPATALYIIHSGSIFVNFDILREGECFGSRVFYAVHPTMVYGHTAACLSNSIVYKITRPILLRALELYGDSWVTKSGTQIPYSRLVHLHGTIIDVAGTIRKAAVMGLVHGFNAGIAVLTARFGDDVLLDRDSPLISIYSSYTRRLVSQGGVRVLDAAKSTAVPTPPDTQPTSRSTSMTKQDSNHRAIMGDMKLGEESKATPSPRAREAEWLNKWLQAEVAVEGALQELQQRHIPKEEVEKQQADLKALFHHPRTLALRLSNFVQMEQYRKTLQDQNVYCDILLHMSPRDLADVAGMSFGHAFRLLKVFREVATQMYLSNDHGTTEMAAAEMMPNLMPRGPSMDNLVDGGRYSVHVHELETKPSGSVIESQSALGRPSNNGIDHGDKVERYASVSVSPGNSVTASIAPSFLAPDDSEPLSAPSTGNTRASGDLS